MKRTVIVDARESFLADMNTRILIEDSADFEVAGVTSSADDIHKIISNTHPDLLVVSENMLKQQDEWQYDIPVIVYAQSNAGIQMAKEKKLHTYGIVSSTSDLIEAINKNSVLNDTDESPVKQNQIPKINPSTSHSHKEDFLSNGRKEEKTDNIPLDQGLPVLNDDFEFFTDSEKPFEKQTDPFEKKSSAEQFPILNEDSYRDDHLSEPTKTLQEKEDNLSQQPEKETRRMAYADQEQSKDLIEQRLNKDLERRKRSRDTKVVSFYAAKGGVGKTTLSTNIATYLSLMGTERRKNRVCIVDFNIDFGDVLTTLYLDPDGANMLFWADDIDDKLRAGKKKESISYTRTEIESYLQKLKDCDLYALVAPVNHTDSMSLTEEQLEIMINNLILNGDFDYIICDTGNNTRDSTIIALDNSDMIFLVVTQDVTTANCNTSFLETFDRIGFDLNKIHLVVNNILPYKETGISVKDLEDNFPDYPCVARVNHYPAVIRANNLGKPLTLNPTHEYTKELRSIVQCITGVKPEEDEKLSFFSKLFGRKRK